MLADSIMKSAFEKTAYFAQRVTRMGLRRVMHSWLRNCQAAEHLVSQSPSLCCGPLFVVDFCVVDLCVVDLCVVLLQCSLSAGAAWSL